MRIVFLDQSTRTESRLRESIDARFVPTNLRGGGKKSEAQIEGEFVFLGNTINWMGFFLIVKI